MGPPPEIRSFLPAITMASRDEGMVINKASVLKLILFFFSLICHCEWRCYFKLKAALL